MVVTATVCDDDCVTDVDDKVTSPFTPHVNEALDELADCIGLPVSQPPSMLRTTNRSFQRHMGTHMVISVSIALSHTPVYALRPRIRCQCIAVCRFMSQLSPGMGITVILRQSRLLRGNGDRLHGNIAGMGTKFMVIPWKRGHLMR